jgi:hypothetical protein
MEAEVRSGDAVFLAMLCFAAAGILVVVLMAVVDAATELKRIRQWLQALAEMKAAEIKDEYLSARLDKSIPRRGRKA